VNDSSTIPRAHWLAFAVAVLGIWAHQLWLLDWVVDDAAISFAYARNLADGEGLVATLGGERIEGYSNPLWVLILAGFELLGVGGMISSKPLAMGLSAGSAWLAYRLVWGELGRAEALLAPFFLAVAAQFAIWNASGLENPLFTALLLAGLLGVQRGALGWAGLGFAGLALTRPEGGAYGAVIGAWMLALHRRRAWRFWAALLGPVALHQGFRWAYFAWPLPNTYYAKLGISIDRWSLEARGWKQLLAWASATGMGWMLGVFAAAPWGRARAGVVALGLALGALLLPDGWRVGVLLGLGVVVPVFAPGPVLWRMAAHLVVVGLGFSVYAGGDWMRGHRWMSLVMGPLALLFAAGASVWIDALSGYFRDRVRVAWTVGVGLVGGLLSVNAPLTARFAKQPVDYPEMIARRLRYTNQIADRLGLDRRRIRTLDMDMGAHMLWSRYSLVDLAGLVDIPIARHRFTDREFFRKYVFEERSPDFAHLHRYWAKASGLMRFPEWKQSFVQLPPYDDGGRPHDGVWLRRSHVFRVAGDPERLGGLALDGIEVVHGASGERARVELGAHPDTADGVKIQLRGGGELVDVDLGWVARDQWRGETFVQPVFIDVRAPGAPIELLVDGRIVRTLPTSPDRAQQTESELEAAAESGRCAVAVDRWERLRDLHPSRLSSVEAGSRRAIAECYARTATASDDPVAALEEARQWDYSGPDFRAVSAEVATERYRAGLEARAAGDATRAFRAFSDVLRVTPWNAWARFYAEEARDR